MVILRISLLLMVVILALLGIAQASFALPSFIVIIRRRYGYLMKRVAVW